MSGAGWKLWVAGERVDNDDFQSFIQDQVVSLHDDATARDVAITAPTYGMFAALANPGILTFYNGSAWVIVCSLTTHTWTPALTASGGSPTAGTGATVIGQYAYRPGGWLRWKVHIIHGTSPSWGTGTLSISLPVAPAANENHIGAGRLVDSGTANYARHCIWDSGTTFQMISEGGTAVGGTTPFTVAVNDVISVGGEYRY